MTKRLPPKRREPWPAFTLLAAVLAAIALVSVLLLDYLNARQGRAAYLFRAASQAQVPKAGAKPEPEPAEQAAKHPALPSGGAAEKPAAPASAQPAVKPFGEVIAASLAAAGVSEDSVLELK